MRQLLPYLCLFAVSLVVTLVTTPLARKIAIAVGAVDKPSARRINKRPVPRMGGIAIFLGVMASFLVEAIGSTRPDWPIMVVPSPHLQVNYPTLALAFVAIFVVGLIDDKYTLRPLQKFAGQVASSAIAVAGGLVIGVIVNPFDPGATISLGWAAYPLTILYLVAYVNIINLIDGLDGLAAGISGLASATMFVLAIWAGRFDAAALAVSICGACVGFLRYNFHPASIFMGDSGSLLLGFGLGATSLLSVTRIAGLTTIIVPLVIAAVPIIDTFSAIVRRTRAHVSVGHADRGHIHHRLLASGYSQAQTVILMYAWTALLCAGALVMTQLELWPRVLVFVALLILSVIFALKLHLFEPVLLHYYNPQTGGDELVAPGDSAFPEALEEFEEEHEGPIQRIIDEHEDKNE